MPISMADLVRLLTTANQAGSALITSITDPMGRTVGYQYDALHRLSTITAPDGGVTIYTYDVNNRLTTITDPGGITYLTTLYYPSGLVAKQILADGGPIDSNTRWRDRPLPKPK
ncbi:MAG: RHS repeat domain-containing protein [Nitrospiraceae bacterium]